MVIAALLPVFAMDMVVLRAAALGLALGWVMSGVVVRYANVRVVEATGKLVELSNELEVQRNRLTDAMDGSRLAMWDLDVPSGMIHLSANWWALMGGTSRDTSIPIAELIDRVP